MHSLVSGKVSDYNNESVIESRDGSHVIQITNGSHVYRQCYLASLLPITLSMISSNLSNSNLQNPEIGAFQLSYEAGGYLAARHLNERNSIVVPDLQQLMGDCDIRFSYEMFNTQANIRIAMTTFLDTISQTPKPIAIIGEAASKVSTALANLAGVFETPQISGTSTATNLDDKAAAPYFSRMIPTNDQDARALMIYLKHIGVTHFGSIHVLDTYGIGFRVSLIAAAQEFGLTVYPVDYDMGDYSSIASALEYLKLSEVRYFFGVFHHESRKQFLSEGYRLGIMGHVGYVWILSENHSAMTAKDFELDAGTEQDLARAIDGMGLLKIAFPESAALDALLAEFAIDSTLQEQFILAHVSPGTYS